MSRSFSEKLGLYAELAVRAGANIQPGQELLITADVRDVSLVRLMVAEAYRAGAKNVAVLYFDDQNTLARYQLGGDAAMEYIPQWQFDGIEQAMKDNGARLVVFGGDPALLKDIDPARVAAYSRLQGKATERVNKMIGGFAINWCIVGSAGPEWAKTVFPGVSEGEAVDRLWDAIFSVSRVDAEKPLEAWKAHQDELGTRAAQLTALKLDHLHFQGPGTDLTIGIADQNRWIGGWGNAANGVRCSPNIPTEEVFTIPHRERVSGYVSSTKPLSLRGQVIDGIRVEFEGGKVTKASARVGEEALLKLLDTDDGARRLGEVALVPASSPISKSGALFYNTLFDENAACHIALGRSIDECFDGNSGLSDEQRLECGANVSLVHVDWMIGSDQIDVDGVGKDGTQVPILRKGEWAIDL